MHRFFCAEHCCSIFFFFLIFKVTFTLHCFSAEKVAFLYCGHLKKKLGLEFGGRVKWSVGGGRRGKLDDLIMTTLRLVFACMSVGVTVPPLLQSSNGFFHCASLSCRRLGYADLLSKESGTIFGVFSSLWKIY